MLHDKTTEIRLEHMMKKYMKKTDQCRQEQQFDVKMIVCFNEVIQILVWVC